MNLVLTEEQDELRDMVRRLLAPHADSSALRRAAASADGFDRSLWQALAELGLVGLTVSPEFDGSGAGAVERSIVLEELGRAMVPHPYLSSAVLGTDVVTLSGDESAMADYLPRICAGQLLVAVGIGEGANTWPADGGKTTARFADGWTLTGTKDAVMHADSADLLVVLAASAEGPAWFAVEPGADGVVVDALTSIDPTRRYSRLTLDGARARLVGHVRPGDLDRVRERAVTALAAEQVGGMGRILEMTAEYATSRTQFGRAIGSFQAVKHGLADVYCTWELALSVVRYASWTQAESPQEHSQAAALAGALVPRLFFEATQAGIQYHGGIGYTAEHDAHLYFSRAKAGELIFGGASERREVLAGRLGL